MQTQGSLPTFEDKVAQRAIVNIYLTRFDHTMTVAYPVVTHTPDM